MSRKRKNPKTRVEEASVRPSLSRLTRLLYTLIAVALIVYTGAQLAMRTDGFRSIVEKRLARLIGLSVVIDRVGADARLGIRAEGVAIGDALATGGYPLTIRKARFDWSLRRLSGSGETRGETLALDGADLQLTMTPDGRLQPEVLALAGAMPARWAGLPVAETGAHAAHPDGGPDVDLGLPALMDMALRLTNGSLRVWRSTGECAVACSGVALDCSPLRAPGRAMTHVRLSVDRVEIAGIPRVERLQFEMLDLGGEKIVLGLEADWKGGSPADFLGSASFSSRR